MKTKPTETFNVQKRCEEIHAQYGTSEMANHQILLMCDKIENRAFEAGRKSVIESASKLNWEELGIYGRYGTYLDVCLAHKPLGDFLIRQRYQPKDIELYFLDEDSKWGFKSVEEAKEYANEMYKNKIKKVLGL
ncbi:MAG: hypothetical protein MSG77_04945 [Prevotella sp.]|nr:hypothetical protein [Prevotella sp.]